MFCSFSFWEKIAIGNSFSSFSLRLTADQDLAASELCKRGRSRGEKAAILQGGVMRVIHELFEDLSLVVINYGKHLESGTTTSSVPAHLEVFEAPVDVEQLFVFSSPLLLMNPNSHYQKTLLHHFSPTLLSNGNPFL